MKRFNLSEWAVTHQPMVLFLIILTLVVGLFSFSRLGRLEDPTFEVPQMTAIVVWPGATAQDVQDQVLNRIERKLQELEHFDYARSFSRQGYGGITLWMKGGSSKAELDEAWYQVRKKIGDMRSTLPQGVIGPVFNDDFGDVYGSIFALSADGFSDEELRVFAERVRTQLLGPALSEALLLKVSRAYLDATNWLDQEPVL